MIMELSIICNYKVKILFAKLRIYTDNVYILKTADIT